MVNSDIMSNYILFWQLTLVLNFRLKAEKKKDETKPLSGPAVDPYDVPTDEEDNRCVTP